LMPWRAHRVRAVLLIIVKNKFSDPCILHGLFGLILNLSLGDRRAIGIREDEPMDVSNVGLLQIRFYFCHDLPTARG
jgi:hypothetical protein